MPKFEVPFPVYEDNHLLIVYKPSGWLVQGDRTGDETLTDWGRSYIKEKYEKPGEVFLHPSHRIDRPVSGLVVFGRTSKGLERMNKLFKEDLVEKCYLAIVGGKVRDTEQTLVHWIEKNPKTNTVKVFDKEKGKSKRAELTFETILVLDDRSLLLVYPKTGRPHQIRGQLSKIGHPIEGDIKYGYDKPQNDRSISLHAFKKSFVHPVRKENLVVKTMPRGENWAKYLDRINELD